MLTIKQKIKEAKKIFVYLDPEYQHNDVPLARKAPTVRISAAQAHRIVDMSPKDKQPGGVIDSNGNLLLQPHEG